MTAAHNQSQPICATPPADLLRLADWIDEARNAYLDAITRGPGGEVEKRVLANRLWDDKGTFAPALRQAAEVATLRAKVDEQERELAEWKQAASVEAGLRREFADKVDELTAGGRPYCDPIAQGKAFYLAMYEHEGANWDANENQEVWVKLARDYERRRREALALNSQHSDGEVGR